MNADTGCMWTPLALAFLALASCRTGWKEIHSDPSFRPTEAKPLRVAMLPLRDDTGGTSVFLYPVLPFIWAANLVTLHLPEGTPDSEEGARLLAQLLEARLRGTPVNVLGPEEVDARLRAAPGAPAASSLGWKQLGELLEVDAVLTGSLTSWSTSYYVAESRTVVEASVRIVSTKDGAEWLRATIGSSDGGGVAEGPIQLNWFSYALQPISALGTGPFRDLAIAWVQLAGDAILGAPDATDPGAATAPAIESARIVHERQGPWRAGEEIVVEARGTPGCDATFDLATFRRRIPMARVDTVEDATAGELATYRGRYGIADDDRLLEGPIVVTLRRDVGRATKPATGGLVTIGP